MKIAMAILAEEARTKGKERAVHLRVGELDGKIYFDLGDALGHVVEIGPEEWRVTTDSPVVFRHPEGMRRLPVPIKDPTARDQLRGLVNLPCPDDFDLYVAWLLGSMYASGPYPILGVISQPGFGKSWLSRIAREIIDPNYAPIRGMPKNEHDFIIAAANSWVIAMDNLTSIPDWFGDALCRLSTGGGFAARRLYSDDEQILFNVQRPAILTGVEAFLTRADLLDRAIVLEPPAFRPGERRPEAELLKEFRKAHAGILGWLFSVLAGALGIQDMFTPEDLPRMADFAARIAACEPFFLSSRRGQFARIYEGNRHQTDQVSIDASPVGRYLVELGNLGNWTGSASALLRTLAQRAGSIETRAKSWPQTPHALSLQVRRIQPCLQACGLQITFSREAGGNRDRLITLFRRPQ